MFTDIIIMAGGSGTRLWPASNSKTPKQFLSINGDSSFFDAALERSFAVLGDESPEGRVIVVASATHVAHVVRSCAKLTADARERVVVIGEPVARNTAPALACAAVYLRRVLGPARRALMLTADHIIAPVKAFCADAAAAADLAAEGRLVVFGIPPRGPETGYGYIEAAGPLGSVAAPNRAFEVASFREKPNKETAESFLATGRFYWNSGMFGFDIDFLLNEFRTNASEASAPFEALETPGPDALETRGGVAVLTGWKGLSEAYASAKSISIDYAIAEKCLRTAVVAGSFDWLDIGSWDEYARFIEGSAAGSAIGSARPANAPVFSAGASHCFVDSDLPVALCGVDDLIVVVRSGADGGPPAVLVCKKGRSQTVKDAVEAIKTAGRADLL